MITTLIILSIVLGLKQLGVNLPFVDKTINIMKTKIDKNNKIENPIAPNNKNIIKPKLRKNVPFKANIYKNNLYSGSLKI